MTTIVVDDHLLHDVLEGQRALDLGGLANRLATRRVVAISAEQFLAVGAVPGLPAEQLARYRAQLVALPAEIDVLHLRNLAWPMAELQQRHRGFGHHLSAAMVEALAAAHELKAGIAVSRDDVGPGLMAAANEDGIEFHAL